MAVFKVNNTSVPVTDLAPPKNIEQTAYRSSTVSEKNGNLTRLISHVAGYSWTVDAFFQILGPHDAPKGPEITLHPTMQQYNRVVDFELRVQDPLTHEWAADIQADSLTGSALFYPGMPTPNIYDVFFADIGNGQRKIFIITDVEPASHLMQRVWRVNYRSSRDCEAPHDVDILNKVIKTSYFRKDFLMEGQNPVLSAQQVHYKEEIDREWYAMINHHITHFYNRSCRLPTLPERDRNVYDHHMWNYLGRALDLTTINDWRNADLPSIPILETRYTTIWDMLLRTTTAQHRDRMPNLISRMIITDTWVLKGRPEFSGIYYSNVHQLVWPLMDTQNDDWCYPIHTLSGEVEPPIEDDEDIDDGETPPDVETPPEEPTEPVDPEEPDDEEETPLPPPEIVILEPFKPVTEDEYYVLSEAFYRQERTEMSLLELLFTQMLSREVIPEAQLLELCQEYYKLPPLERFYYGPILIGLLTYAGRRVAR